MNCRIRLRSDSSSTTPSNDVITNVLLASVIPAAFIAILFSSILAVVSYKYRVQTESNCKSFLHILLILIFPAGKELEIQNNRRPPEGKTESL